MIRCPVCTLTQRILNSLLRQGFTNGYCWNSFTGQARFLNQGARCAIVDRNSPDLPFGLQSDAY